MGSQPSTEVKGRVEEPAVPEDEHPDLPTPFTLQKDEYTQLQLEIEKTLKEQKALEATNEDQQDVSRRLKVLHNLDQLFQAYQTAPGEQERAALLEKLKSKKQEFLSVCEKSTSSALSSSSPNDPSKLKTPISASVAPPSSHQTTTASNNNPSNSTNSLNPAKSKGNSTTEKEKTAPSEGARDPSSPPSKTHPVASRENESADSTWEASASGPLDKPSSPHSSSLSPTKSNSPAKHNADMPDISKQSATFPTSPSTNARRPSFSIPLPGKNEAGESSDNSTVSPVTTPSGVRPPLPSEKGSAVVKSVLLSPNTAKPVTTVLSDPFDHKFSPTKDELQPTAVFDKHAPSKSSFSNLHQVGSVSMNSNNNNNNILFNNFQSLSTMQYAEWPLQPHPNLMQTSSLRPPRNRVSKPQGFGLDLWKSPLRTYFH